MNVTVLPEAHHSVDLDARWLKKGKRSYFGYKGFASQANRDHVRGQKIKNGLLYKASRGHELSPRQKKFNRLVSGIRYRVEQCFGTLKRRFRFTRASYLTEVKVEAQMTIKAISFNLLKAYRQVYCV